jgi:glycine dehydrogenase
MSFVSRHVANLNKSTINTLLKLVGTSSLDDLIDKTGIHFTENNEYNSNTLNNNRINAVSEETALANLKEIMAKNKDHTSYLGMGYYNTITPSPIKRHLIENPEWYTAYTPYQAEISQGRLESQYNYQTVIKELTGMPIANASLLDEASAAGEAVNLSYAYYKKKRDKFIVSENLHPQTLDILETRARILNLKMEILDPNLKIEEFDRTYDKDELFNVIFQYPDTFGDIRIPYNYLDFAKENKILTTGITDLLALTKIITPAELGCSIALGNCQRFGMPLWYGGPHPAFFAVTPELLRFMPGKLIGESKDSQGNNAYRLALQTREQHIKRDKATSNICTSQSLLTNVVSFYSIYHGPKKLTEISKKINNKAKYFLENVNSLPIVNDTFFDTITLSINNPDKFVEYIQKYDILVRKSSDTTVSFTFDETISYEDIDALVKYTKCYDSHPLESIIYNYSDYQLPDHLRRKTAFLTQEVFNKYHTETDLMRYMKHLASKDYTLCDGIIPLGSCTMKLNASYQLEPLVWDKVANIHPFVPLEYAEGYQELIKKTGDYFKKLTGFNHISFQPNSGATGEYAGLLCIKKYHEINYKLTQKYGNDGNDGNTRNICLIPNSAHGTNFASAAVANLKVKTFDDNILKDMDKFEALLEKHKNSLACLMITYPNTNGVFQENIIEINKLVHTYGGLVYMDGANMNALVGITEAYKMGFDVCHLNLHKTFCIPHGGGGPGLGPILCNNKLAPYLPTNTIQMPKSDALYSNNSCGAVAASNWSSASLLTIPYLYISAMGTSGLKQATQMAILNSNYLKNSLQDSYTIIDVNKDGFVGHEFIIDVSEFKELDITENDIAKRLIDYSFHPPTMSWPRSGVLMFEPTESESKEELDRLIIAMKSIRREIQDIEDGLSHKDINVLKNSPHSFRLVENWTYPYSIKEALYPVDNLYVRKFMNAIGRVDDVYGDKQMLSNKITE